MTDSQDTVGFRHDDDAGHRVADLASRAIAELAARRASQQSPLSERLTDALVAALIEFDESRLAAAVTDIRHSGIPDDEIVDLYIPEAARRLGDRWCEDRLGFAEVTIGTARLQRLLRNLSPNPRDCDDTGQATASILVVVREGEFHTLGAMIATTQLRRDGLSVRLMLCEPDTAVLRTVAQGNYDAMLLSVACAEKVAQIRRFVTRLRDAGSPSAKIGLGGAVGHLGNEIRTLAGVDFVSTDAREAVRQCGLKSTTNGARQRAMMA